MDREKLNWRSFVSQESTAVEWNNPGTPMDYVIDHRGVIRYKWFDYPGEKALATALEGLIREIAKTAFPGGCHGPDPSPPHPERGRRPRLPRRFRHPVCADRQPDRLPDGVCLGLLGGGDRHALAGHVRYHPDRDDRPGATD